MRFNPFNPTQPARPDFFVGREPEITEFEKKLTQTVHGSPMNMAITGSRGMGKTSLIVKFEHLAKQRKCLVLRLSNYEGNISNLTDFCDYIASNLKRELLSKKSLDENFDKLKNWIATFKPTVSWNEISLSIEKAQVVQEVFLQRMLKLWDESKNEFSAVVILFDEAESIENIKGVLPFMREVFQRIESESKFCIVLAGKLSFTEQISESFSPLNRFFPCYRLSPLDNNSMQAYIVQRLESVNVKIDEEVISFILSRSKGHPYVLVSMCYLLFDSLNEDENQITSDVLTRSKEKMESRLAQDFFEPMFHPLTTNAKEILIAIAKNLKTPDFTFREAVKWLNKPKNYVSPYLKELIRKGILEKPVRAKYQIFHPLFLEYIQHR